MLHYKSPVGKYRHPRVYIPQQLVKVIISTHHEPAHTDHRRTIRAIKRKYYWHSLTPDTREFVNACEACQAKKSPTGRKPNVWQNEKIVSIYPFQYVQADISGAFPKAYDGGEYILKVKALKV